MIKDLLTRPWVKIGLKITVVVVGAGALGIIAVFGAAKAYDVAYADRILPGVYVFDINLSGLTEDAARQKIQTRLEQALQNGFVFHVGDEEIRLADKRTYIRYDIDKTIDAATKEGRGSSLMKNTFIRLVMNLRPRRLTIPVEIQTSQLQAALKERVKARLIAPVDARLVISVEGSDQTPTVNIVPEQIGHVIDFDPAIATLTSQAHSLSFTPIAVQVSDVTPMLRTADVTTLASQVPDWLSHAPFTITTEGRQWTVTNKLLASWITVTSTPSGWALNMDPDRVDATLRGFTKGLLDEPIDGSLTLVDGKVKEFTAPQEGVRLNPTQAIDLIQTSWSSGSSTVAIPLEHVTPKITGKDAEEMGIQEIIGIGRSNFSGSPTNRRKNIARGAEVIQGTLIMPDEEFSINKRLGEIDGANGWFPELVIKGDKTVPEFGGGLCQIGTTMFRTALATGLPITERRNHSYRVRYYEPAGTDATIYGPSPDLKFLNDTGHWILVTTRIKDSDITFTFWGTKDGRSVVMTKPRVYNIVAAPEKKVIETTDIPAGTTKCTESAHAGATASFDYTVTYASGEVKKVNFTSYYKPWGAVCMVGVSSPSTATTSSTVNTSGINNPN